MAVSVKVEGLRALDRQLARLSSVGAGKALRMALTRSARPIVRDAKARANSARIRDSGALAAAIGTFSRRDSRRGRMTVNIGPKKRAKRALSLYLARHPDRADDDPKQQSSNVIRHGHLVEFGTSSGAKAQPFLRPAFDANVAGVTDGIARELAAAIAKVAAAEA